MFHKIVRLVLVTLGLAALVALVALFTPATEGIHAAPLDSWSVLAHNGMNGPVYAMLQHGSDLYVGGHFNRTQDNQVDTLNGVARWDGSA
jgi:hypothetical protein